MHVAPAALGRKTWEKGVCGEDKGAKTPSNDLDGGDGLFSHHQPG